jgi:hypothetical protein
MRRFTHEYTWAYAKARHLHLDPVSASYRALRFALFGNSGRMKSKLALRSVRFRRSGVDDGSEEFSDVHS